MGVWSSVYCTLAGTAGKKPCQAWRNLSIRDGGRGGYAFSRWREPRPTTQTLLSPHLQGLLPLLPSPRAPLQRVLLDIELHQSPAAELYLLRAPRALSPWSRLALTLLPSSAQVSG